MATEEEIKKVAKARSKKDMRNLIQAILDSPIKDEPIEEIDGVRSLESMKKKNTTVVTRILIQTALDAMKGDEKKAKLLFDYAGYMPTKEQQISMELPQIIDDMSVSTDVECRKVKSKDETNEA